MSFNLLVVDDSPVARKIVRKAIGMSGLPVGEMHEAGNGLEALAVLEQHWVDAVFADINMPKMAGDVLIEHMHRSELLREIPVLVVSSDRTEARAARMRELGVRVYLTKPLTPEVVKEAVEAVLLKGEAR